MLLRSRRDRPWLNAGESRGGSQGQVQISRLSTWMEEGGSKCSLAGLPSMVRLQHGRDSSLCDPSQSTHAGCQDHTAS